MLLAAKATRFLTICQLLVLLPRRLGLTTELFASPLRRSTGDVLTLA